MRFPGILKVWETISCYRPVEITLLAVSLAVDSLKVKVVAERLNECQGNGGALVKSLPNNLDKDSVIATVKLKVVRG